MYIALIVVFKWFEFLQVVEREKIFFFLSRKDGENRTDAVIIEPATSLLFVVLHPVCAPIVGK